MKRLSKYKQIEALITLLTGKKGKVIRCSSYPNCIYYLRCGPTRCGGIIFRTTSTPSGGYCDCERDYYDTDYCFLLERSLLWDKGSVEDIKIIQTIKEILKK